MFVSHAQNFEDVMLWRALKHVQQGFYIDIGANDPVVDSVSLAFYERGWRGVHVEPLQLHAERLRAARPGDDVHQVAIAATAGPLDFYSVGYGGLSTGLQAIAEAHAAQGYPVRVDLVPSATLATLLDGYRDREVHWLKIDVEGMEAAVLSTFGASVVRPWIVLIESTRPSTSEDASHAWSDLVVGQDYTPVYFDGLNTFYLRNDLAHLAPHFSHGPCVFDAFALSGTSSNGFTTQLTSQISAQAAEIRAGPLARRFPRPDRARGGTAGRGAGGPHQAGRGGEGSRAADAEP